MPRVRHSASTRPRVRLISTPNTTTLEGPTLTSTIEGVRFSDQLAALLDHAAANGFRVEPDTRAKAKGVVVYPPNKDFGPVTVEERGAKFNKPHYENIRRDLYRAGLPPLPGDTAHPNAKPEEDTVTVRHIHNERELTATLTDPDKRAETLAGIVDGMFNRADLGGFAGLAGALVYATAAFADEAKGALGAAALEQATKDMQAQIDEALRMAADHEATAVRLQKALDRAEAAEAKAREDCGEALERAKAAEAEAAKLERALAPLRALLGKD